MVDLTRNWSVGHEYRVVAAELRKLADGRDEERAPVGWLESPGAAQRQPIETATNPYFGHLPETSWRMLASGV